MTRRSAHALFTPYASPVYKTLAHPIAPDAHPQILHIKHRMHIHPPIPHSHTNAFPHITTAATPHAQEPGRAAECLHAVTPTATDHITACHTHSPLSHFTTNPTVLFFPNILNAGTRPNCGRPSSNLRATPPLPPPRVPRLRSDAPH